MPTLDERLIRIPINEIIRYAALLSELKVGNCSPSVCVHSPGHEKRIVGEGMPLVEDPTKRGDLVVKFQLKFPSTLDKRQKLLLKQALIEKDS